MRHLHDEKLNSSNHFLPVQSVTHLAIICIVVGREDEMTVVVVNYEEKEIFLMLLHH